MSTEDDLAAWIAGLDDLFGRASLTGFYRVEPRRPALTFVACWRRWLRLLAKRR